jgi:hypothetical protein
MKKNLLYVYLPLITLGVALYFFLINYAVNLDVLFNSDHLSPIAIYQDLFFKHGHLKDWTFSADSFFFPDMLVFLIGAFFVKKLPLAVLLSDGIFLLFYYILLVAVGKLIAGKKNKNFFKISGLLSLMMAGTYFASQDLLTPVFLNHFAANIVIYLLNIFLILKILRTEKNNSATYYFCLLAILCFLTSFSDPLFFVIFFSVFLGLLTVGFCSVFPRKERLTHFIIAITVLIFGLLGFLANVQDWFQLNVSFDIQAEALHHSWRDWINNFLLNPQRYSTFHQVFAIFYSHNPIICLLLLAFLIVGTRLFFKSILGRVDFEKQKYSLLIIISLTFCIYISLVAGLFLDPGLLLGAQGLLLRHYQTMIILPIFLGIPIFLSQSHYKGICLFVNQYFLHIVGLILATMLILAPVRSFTTFKGMVNYYPPITACLDNYLDKGELGSANGVTGYWEAHVNNVLSHSPNQLNLVAVTGDLEPYDWISTTADYKNKQFSFFLLKDGSFSPTAVQTVYGRPDKTLMCPAIKNYKIYVYNKPFILKKNTFSMQSAQQFADSLKLGQSYPIITNSPFMKLKEFGANEINPGIWTISKHPSVILYISAKTLTTNPVGSIHFKVSPFLYTGITAQKVYAQWGSNQKAEYAVNSEQEIAIPYVAADWQNVTQDGALKEMKINFYLPNAMKPSDIAPESLDYRLLALRFESFYLS